MTSCGFAPRSHRASFKLYHEIKSKNTYFNDKRLEALQKTVEIQAKMLATAIEGDSDEVLRAVNLYTQAYRS
jgi:hypothetical protein